MVLSDRSIKSELAKGRIVIDPRDDSCIQPASVDIHLDKTFRIFRPWKPPYFIDLSQPLDNLTDLELVDKDGYFALGPGQFVLGTTIENIELPDDIMGRLEGKSSLGRIGLLIHATAGYVDPGWRGHLTLELSNVSAIPILLFPGMKISQISFHRLETPAERPYGSPGLGSKYQGQSDPTPTRFYHEFSQTSLMSMPGIPTTSKPKRVRGNIAILKDWLDQSEYAGNIKLFSEALSISYKTVQDWFYRGVTPNQVNRSKIFEVTRLPKFDVGYRTLTPTLPPKEGAA